MPGMMDSILNIGINAKNVDALASNFNDERFALDSYRRLIQMYGNIVLKLIWTGLKPLIIKDRWN